MDLTSHAKTFCHSPPPTPQPAGPALYLANCAKGENRISNNVSLVRGGDRFRPRILLLLSSTLQLPLLSVLLFQPILGIQLLPERDLSLEEDEQERQPAKRNRDLPHRLKTLRVEADDALSQVAGEGIHKGGGGVLVGSAAGQRGLGGEVGYGEARALERLLKMALDDDAPDAAEAVDEGPCCGCGGLIALR